MTVLSLIGLVNSITNISLIVVLLIYGKAKLHKIWAFFNFILAIWGFGLFLVGHSITVDMAVRSWKLAMSGVIFIPVLFIHTVSLFCNFRMRNLILFSYFQGFIFLFLNLFKNLFVKKLYFAFNSFYYVSFSLEDLTINIFTVIWVSLIFIGFYNLFKLCKTSKEDKHLQGIYFFVHMLIGFSGGSMSFLPAYGINVYPYYNLTMPISVCFITYAILKHRLAELNVIIKKGLQYSILVSMLTLIYLLFVLMGEKFLRGLIGYRSFLVSLGSASIIALSFIPLRNNIQRFLDHRFFKGTLESLAQEKEKLREELFHFEKLAYVGKLASSIAHEIKNPLTVIKTYTEYLPSKFQDPEFREKFQSLIPKEIERIDKTVAQLLDLAKPRKPFFEKNNLISIIDTTLSFLENSFNKNAVVVKKEYISDNVIIEVDKEQMRQVFLNLFLNAIQAMPSGGTLTVATQINHCNQNNLITVIISDTGNGISQDNLNKLFTPFFTTKKEGIGLGLVIVHEIIRNHKGKISVESEAGKGTRFIIRLPANQMNNEEYN